MSKAGLRLYDDYDFLVEGDDNIIACNDDEKYHDAATYVTSLGFKCVSECPDSIESADFIGWRFHLDHTTSTITPYRDPIRFLRKFAISNTLCTGRS